MLFNLFDMNIVFLFEFCEHIFRLQEIKSRYDFLIKS